MNEQQPHAFDVKFTSWSRARSLWHTMRNIPFQLNTMLPFILKIEKK